MHTTARHDSGEADVSTAHRMLPIIERLDRNGVLALRPEWDGLLAASERPTPFLAWPWIGAWLDTLGSDADLQVLAARDPSDGRLIGVAPFTVAPMRRHGIRYRALRFLATGPLGGRGLDLIIERDHGDPTARALWEETTRDRRWDLLDVAGLCHDGALASLLLRRRSDADSSDLVASVYADLTTDEIDPVTARTGQSIRLVTSERDLATSLAGMARLAELPSARRVPFSHPSVLRFHREAARRLLDAGRLRLWTAHSGDRLTAAVYGARFDETVATYTAVTADDPNADLPTLLAHAMRSAADEGATGYVLPPGAPPVLGATGTRHDATIRRPVGSWGRILWSGQRARSAIGRIRRRAARG